jgi:hypothetical protein
MCHQAKEHGHDHQAKITGIVKRVEVLALDVDEQPHVAHAFQCAGGKDGEDEFIFNGGRLNVMLRNFAGMVQYVYEYVEKQYQVEDIDYRFIFHLE